MAGMLPGVESARRRRFHQSGINGGCSNSPTTSTLSRRSSFCLYTTNHDSHLASISSTLKRRPQQSQDEKLGDAAREAKERLDERLRTQWKSDSKRAGGGRERSVEMRELQIDETKKSGSKKLRWGKLSWKSSEQDECAVSLEYYKQGENLMHLPCAHRFHSRCLVPWLEKNQHCPCCRMEF